ncbi:hypothetical protein SFHH103_03038 [Sinorhizobium fredii HH103]|uniref:Uncharacterized protein n=1 Tax=Sinorhizobium fredii (strain HH103) TaxID=1117943 RepID=G9A1F0_SINF1|nr:hypothetical protein SFHH103_03038 [Sinorhizobium fredii HH103]
MAVLPIWGFADEAETGGLHDLMAEAVTAAKQRSLELGQ